MIRHRLPAKPRCPSCGALVNGATEFDAVSSPQAGDFSVCLYCGAILQFTSVLSLVKASPAEFAALPADQQQLLRKLQQGIRH